MCVCVCVCMCVCIKQEDNAKWWQSAVLDQTLI